MKYVYLQATMTIYIVWEIQPTEHTVTGRKKHTVCGKNLATFLGTCIVVYTGIKSKFFKS